MLGRLRMSVDECIAAYLDFSEKVFGKGTRERYDGMLEWAKAKGISLLNGFFKNFNLVTKSYMFNATTLQNVIQDVVAKYSNGNRDAEMHDQSSKCRVYVVFYP
jgi:hypothetical protein